MPVIAMVICVAGTVCAFAVFGVLLFALGLIAYSSVSFGRVWLLNHVAITLRS